MNRSNPSQAIQLKFVLFVLLLILCWGVGRFFQIDEARINAWLDPYPLALSGVLFVVLYVVLTFFVWFSKDLLRIAGAYVFGANLSTFLIWVSESINAVILFNLSRSMGRAYVEGKLKGRYVHFDERLEYLKFWDFFSLRAVVIVPYRFLDLGCGLTRIPLKKYMTAVLLGSPVRIYFQQYFWIALGKTLFNDIRVSTDYFESHPIIALMVLLYAGITLWIIVRMKKILWP